MKVWTDMVFTRNKREVVFYKQHFPSNIILSSMCLILHKTGLIGRKAKPYWLFSKILLILAIKCFACGSLKKLYLFIMEIFKHTQKYLERYINHPSIPIILHQQSLTHGQPCNLFQPLPPITYYFEAKFR